ncbi:MAG: hypothetical protein P8R54_00670 [Myxococcota bacterium]|nr:hypothetical protein [Myxococcota bacterium]
MADWAVLAAGLPGNPDQGAVPIGGSRWLRGYGVDPRRSLETPSLGPEAYGEPP